MQKNRKTVSLAQIMAFCADFKRNIISTCWGKSLLKWPPMGNSIKIIAISDTHNLHAQLEIPDGDILVHAGDMTMNGTEKEVLQFNEFLGTLPHKHKLIIAGNHDHYFNECTASEAKQILSNATYLSDESITIEGIRFYGMGWDFRGWDTPDKVQKICNHTDILITHEPPYGYCDLRNNRHYGCLDLAGEIDRIKAQFHTFGHIHSGYGICQSRKTRFINASSCTDNYQLLNAPIAFHWKRE